MKTRRPFGQVPAPLLAIAVLAVFISLARPFLRAHTAESEPASGGVCNNCPMFSLSVLEKRQPPPRPDLDFNPAVNCLHWSVDQLIPDVTVRTHVDGRGNSDSIYQESFLDCSLCQPTFP